MLQRLTIRNYAIIDYLEVDFSQNLNVITGETGAGKSILLGALSLILGERADPGVLFDKTGKCIIEGFFKVKKAQVLPFFEKYELDLEDLLIIRREISATGKSRAFVNDTPVNISQLGELSSSLVDLHQQFDTLALANADFQREVIDALVNKPVELQQYQQIFSQYQQVQKRYKQLVENRDVANKELDYNRFLLDELTEANFYPNEIEELDAELQTLSHAEEIKNTLNRIFFQLKEDEQPILQQLKQLQASLSGLSNFHKEIPALAERLFSTYVELQDIANEVESINDQVYYDGARIEVVNERLTTGYRLFKKHSVQTTNELLAIKEVLENKVADVLNLDDQLLALEQEQARLKENLQQLAGQISAYRKEQAAPFAQRVNELLAQVGMPNARLKVEITAGELNPHGQDTIDFLFDANKSNQFAPVGKVASGGELSRIMLCIKSLVAQSVALPTLIFDEIDTGISGEAARQVGIILKDLAKSHQIICITHQPQIAGKADAHYFVFKDAKADKVTTSVRLLSVEERVNKIAQMLSGERPTAAALENAREMLTGI
ncbi:DNA repair protein RecN (Recombination protein N) [Chitinophaga terrae (ex Kim and Jung 2007)]|uniref:DNA repair protein RecN n=1 Tax=Chitinophaga terrae (ex Kim and Jung 2007) TaxID=408074 RepID=UPI00277E6047|nr:DNA repair protein RecN [Chitinophaga terrae (ex Kim and Jung 2007)]MDQ0107712.1 DNA repair protein RecN (Recombination protein N) [Chitinophaga terrae (ex Kim and Jung 2007)]